MLLDMRFFQPLLVKLSETIVQLLTEIQNMKRVSYLFTRKFYSFVKNNKITPVSLTYCQPIFVKLNLSREKGHACYRRQEMNF